jgi:IS1 family transposase/transposase-like protein
VCKEEVTCPRCASLHIKKNGITAKGKQRYRCSGCHRQFITRYSYQGCVPFVRSLIVPMTLNGSGIRDITRVLRVSINTVLKVIRQQAASAPEPSLPKRLSDAEVDEMWSFIGKKRRQCWLWYAFSPKTKQIIGYVLGRRTDESLARLLCKLAQCRITRFYTDDWESYQKLIPSYRHWIGKMGTQRIERQNLNFRTHLKRLQRRTICFSKSEEMHQAVIKLYINYSNARSLFSES